MLELAEGMRPAEPEPAVVEEEAEEKKSRKSSTSSSSSSSSSSDDEKDEEKKKEKKEKKMKKKAKAAIEAVASAEVATEVAAEVEEKKEEVEEKKEEVEEKKEEAEEKKDEMVVKTQEVIAVLPGEEGTRISEKVLVSEERSYTKQTSSSEKEGFPELMLSGEDGTFSSSTETSSSSFVTTRVVSSKQVVTSSSTTQRIITSEGSTIQAFENGESEKVYFLTLESNFHPYIPKILLVILPVVCHMMLVLRTGKRSEFFLRQPLYH